MGNVHNSQNVRNRERERHKPSHLKITNSNTNLNTSSDDAARVARFKSIANEDVPNFMEKTRFNATRRSSVTAEVSPALNELSCKSDVNSMETFSRPRSNTVSGTQYSTNKQLPTVFRWEGGGKQVSIGGDFSQWKTVPMAKSHGDFVAIIDLPEGEHAYKFYVDGEWKHDPDMNIVENKSGSKTNIVQVKKSDFEVFQALEKDIEEAKDSEAMNYKKEYSQDIPSTKPWEKNANPPTLPPHLLQIILNKDTPLSCDPTLLPEPNHVMLNHLFALSIKEGVMVLSASHRYRKKCVTTLLYKQI